MALSVNGGPLTWEADISMGQFMQKLNQIEQGINGVTKASEREMQAVQSLVQKTTTALASFGMAFGASEFVTSLVRVRGEFQKLEAVLGNSLGDKNAAAESLRMISEYAATTPFQLAELGDAYVKLVNQGIKPTRKEMTALGDLAASTGKGFGQLAEAIIDAQVGEMERLKEFGVRAEQQGDKVRFTFKGVTTEVDKSSEAIKNYIISLGNIQGVAGATAAISATLEGRISNLRDAWDRMLNSVGQENEGIFAGAIAAATSAVENYETVLDILKVLVATYGAYRAAIIATTAVQAVATNVAKGYTIAETLRYQAMLLSEKAMKLLNATMLKNPAVAVTTLIAGLAAAMIFLGKETKKVSVITDEYNAELSKEKESLDGLFEKVKATAEGTKERADAIGEINKQYGKYLPNLLSEKSTNEQLAGTYDLLNRKIQENIALKFKNKNVEQLYQQFGEGNDAIFKNIVGTVSKNLGDAKAGQAAAELNKLGDSLAGVMDKIDKLDRKDTKEAVSLFAERNKLVDDYMKKFQLLPKQFNKILEFAGNKNSLKKGLDDIDAFWNNFINTGKKGADDAAKTLADYLKEKDFASVFEKALPLAQSKDDLDDILKRLKKDQGAVDPNAKDFEKQVNGYQKLIDRVQKKIDAYNPNKIAKANADAFNKQMATEKKENALLEARANLLQNIADIRKQAEADTHGKQASAIEKINQKYQGLIDKVEEYNKKAGEWNKDPKNKKNQVNLIGFEATNQINEARALEISQELMEQDVKNYAASLKEKSDLYKQYQQTVQEVGKQDADKLYEDEKLAFDNYLDYLRFEMGKFGTKIALGVELNFADKEKMKQLAEELKKVSKDQADREIADTKRVMVATLNAAEQRKVIEANYLKEVEILRKTYKGEELAERERVLKEGLDNDLRALASHLGEQSELYKAMNRGIYKMASDRINNEIALLKKRLEAVKKSDPAMAAAIEAAIKEWEALQRKMTGSLSTMDKIEAGAQGITGAFSTLAQAVGETNEALAASLKLVSDLAGGIMSAAKSYKTFIDAQDKVIQNGPNAGKLSMEGVMGTISGSLGIFSALVGVIKAIDDIGKKRREADRQFRQQQEESLGRVQAGEAEINALYRERERSQVLINKLRIEGLEAEKRLLEEQAKQVTEQYMKIFDLLGGINPLDALNTSGMTQREVDDLIKLMGGSNGSLGSLANLTFDKLEELYIQNILQGRAKELFETLQKLKAEGADIDKMLADAKKATQELFTGTTSDSIADSLIEGFKKGYRSAKDFADNFQELMQGAVLNALKYQTLEKPLQDFYAQFAASAQSDGALTQSEIADLQKIYNDLIIAAGKQFEDLQKVTGVNMSGGGSGTNSLQGAIKGMTQETAELLAGQFAGQRIATLELLKVAQTNLSIQTRIQNNTGISAQKLTDLMDKLNRLTNGTEVLHTKTR